MTAISSDIVFAAAQDIVNLGLQDAGYEYVNIDVSFPSFPPGLSRLFMFWQDCWAETKRDATTQRIIPDPTKFPSGIDGLASQIHALGLKVGIYRSVTRSTNWYGDLREASLEAMLARLRALDSRVPWATRTLTQRRSMSGVLTVSIRTNSFMSGCSFSITLSDLKYGEHDARSQSSSRGR